MTCSARGSRREHCPGGCSATGLGRGRRGRGAYAARHRGPRAALAATGAGKFLFGILSVTVVLLYRHYFYPSSAPVAEGHVVVLATVSAVGYGCAALVVPPATRRLTKPAVITLLLAASAVATAVLGSTFNEIAYLAFGFTLYLCLQGVAICVTTVLQEDVDDAYRGHCSPSTT